MVMFWEPLIVLAVMISGLASQAQPTAILTSLTLSILLWLIPYGEMSIPFFLALLYPFTILANIGIAFRSLVYSLGGRIVWKGRSIARTRWKWP
jgi:hypothetical protein